MLRLWRPTPLYRAHRLERALGTRSRIYYKYEGVSPAGSHKPNTAVAQAFYNAKAGRRRLATETGAGQWGSSLALPAASSAWSARSTWCRVSYDQKPYRRMMMETWGAEVVPSPSPDTAAGRGILEADPESPGSLGIAISEAVEDAASHDDTSYSLGSVLNHVLLHQTVIGQEAQRQLALAGERSVDVVLGCVGGGSNFAGIALPFVRDKIAGDRDRDRGLRAGGLPDADPRPVRLRLRRHGAADAAGGDAHAGPRLRAARHPRRRPALPRRGADRAPSCCWTA